MRIPLILLSVSLCASAQDWQVHTGGELTVSMAAQREFRNFYRKLNETAMNLGQRLKDGVIQKSFGHLQHQLSLPQQQLEEELETKFPVLYQYIDEQMDAEIIEAGSISPSMEWLLYNLLWIMLLLDFAMLTSMIYMCKGPKILCH